MQKQPRGRLLCFISDLFRDLHRQLEYALDACLEVGAGYLAAFKCGFQLLGLAVAHLDIVARREPRRSDCYGRPSLL